MEILKTPEQIRRLGLLYPKMNVDSRLIGNNIHYSSETYIRLERDGKYYLVPLLFRHVIHLFVDEDIDNYKMLRLCNATIKMNDQLHTQAYMVKECFIIQDKDRGSLWIEDDNIDPESVRYDKMLKLGYK